MASQIELVAKLRRITGSKMKDCLEAVKASGDDLEAAKAYLQKKGLVSASSKSERSTEQGLILTGIASDRKHAVQLELLCETDFVAKNEEFREFAQSLLDIALKNGIPDTETLLQTSMGEHTVDENIKLKISKFGENMKLGQLVAFSTKGFIFDYQHGDKLNVLVAVQEDQEALARDLAMHVAALSPVAVTREALGNAYLDKQRAMAHEEVQTTMQGKPEAIVAKIVEGKVNKHLSQVVLSEQIFVKDEQGKQTVGDWMKSVQITTLGFVRFALGQAPIIGQ